MASEDSGPADLANRHGLPIGWGMARKVMSGILGIVHDRKRSPSSGIANHQHRREKIDALGKVRRFVLNLIGVNGELETWA